MSGMAPNDTRDNKKPNNAQDHHHIITSRYTLHVTESHVDFVLVSSSRTGKKETARLFTPDSDILSLI